MVVPICGERIVRAQGNTCILTPVSSRFASASRETARMLPIAKMDKLRLKEAN